ncbi:hypothetical protein, partial [Pseudomonas gingeri]|uniref:hypothetical protein n=1 Tax=Pseudomonas gingeri TaxID=117681 RepID=UPI001C432EDE
HYTDWSPWNRLFMMYSINALFLFYKKALKTGALDQKDFSEFPKRLFHQIRFFSIFSLLSIVALILSSLFRRYNDFL